MLLLEIRFIILIILRIDEWIWISLLIFINNFAYMKSFTIGFDTWDVGEDYECISLLGTGSYGSVWLGRHIKSGK